MSDPITAMKKMLAALEFLNREGFVLADHEDEMVEAIKAGRAALAEAEKMEPAAWREHVESRLWSWQQSFVNKHGDQLILEDFMDRRSIDDLVDYVCDEYTHPPTTPKEPTP